MNKIILSIVLMMSSVTAFAQTATCNQQAQYMVDNSNMKKQLGFNSGADFIADPQRLMLTVASYMHALGQLQKDPSKQYFKNLLVVSDGLIRCFDKDSRKLRGEQKKQWRQFNKMVPKKKRAQLAAQALKG